MHALLLGGAEPDMTKTNFVAREATQPMMEQATIKKPTAAPRNASQYKLKCPACSANLSFEEGCVKCHSCGFSQC